MKLLGRVLLEEFIAKHADARKWIENWVDDVESSTWLIPQDISVNYATASFLKKKIIIFNVKGNHYRLVVQVAYNTGVVSVKWVGTHADYDRLTLE